MPALHALTHICTQVFPLATHSPQLANLRRRCAGHQEDLSLSESMCVDLPEGYTELAPGPNPDYLASHIYMEASSPVAPPVQLKLDLINPTCLEPLHPGKYILYHGPLHDICIDPKPTRLWQTWTSSREFI